MKSPSTWKFVTLSLEKSTVKLPQGGVVSRSSSKPIVGGCWRVKCAADWPISRTVTHAVKLVKRAIWGYRL